MITTEYKNNTLRVMIALITLFLSACGGGGQSPGTHSLGGTVSGLNGAVILQNSGSDSLTITANGVFGFSLPVNSGASYSVSVSSQPVGQTCSVSNGNGIASGAVSNLLVTCVLDLELVLQQVKTFRFIWTDVANENEYRLLEDPDGVSGYSQIASIAAGSSSYELEVALPKRINARYILQACNAEGCVESLPLSVSGGLEEAIGYFKPSTTGANHRFGWMVAISADGNTLAVGGQAGSSIFTRNAQGWSEQGFINKAAWSLSLSADGNTLAIGDIYEPSAATGVNGDATDNSAANSGAVFIYLRSNGTWSQQAYVKASNTEADDYFGYSVALSANGNTLAVGANYEDGNDVLDGGNDALNGNSLSGAAYVFARNSASWTQQAYVKGSDATQLFGSSLALSGDGNTLVVGAPGDDTHGADTGRVFVFLRNGSSWAYSESLLASNYANQDQFGCAVALSADGSSLAVTACQEASAATGIDGDQSDNSAGLSGAVYIFNNVLGLFATAETYIKASNSQSTLNFGWSVSLSEDGNMLAVGAKFENNTATGINANETVGGAWKSGAAYLFERKAGLWSQYAYVKSPNSEAEDGFGVSVALSANGDTFVAGAPWEDSAATGIAGEQTDNTISNAGAAYVY